ncbi:MAG: DUF2953 domain-containing protein [Bacillota bacterium]|nr:DUF2953 domain-containing protein [Bacillota bacterium]
MVILFVLLLLLAIIIFFSPLQIQVVAHHSDKNDEVFFKFYLLWGIIKFKVSVKSLELGLAKVASIIHLNQEKTQKSLEVERIVELIKMVNLNLMLQLWQFRKKFIPPVQCSQVIWITKVGLGDAAATGVTAGFFWSVKGLLYSFIRQREKWQLKKTELKVIPNFHKKEFEINIDCIFKFSIGHIIIAGIKLAGYVLYFRIKGGEPSGRPSNRSVNENSYGKY